jgi:hypothetical protein
LRGRDGGGEAGGVEGGELTDDSEIEAGGAQVRLQARSLARNTA